MINNIKSTLGSAFGVMSRHPGVAMAAAVVPFFYDNEDRGYFKTALITTPVMFAGAEILPKLFQSARGSVAHAANVANATNANPIFAPGKTITAFDIQKAASDGTISLKALEEMHARYTATNAGVKAIDIDSLYGRMGSVLKIAEGQERMRSQAVLKSAQAAMTPGDWVSYPQELQGLIDPTKNIVLDKDQIDGIVKLFQNRKDDVFPRRLQSEMQRMRGMKDAGDFILSESFISEASPTKLEVAVAEMSRDAEAALNSVGADGIAEVLKRSTRRKELQLRANLTSKAILDGGTGSINTLELIRTISKNGSSVEEALNIPLDEGNGVVHLGGNIGTARHVLDSDGQIYKAQDWIAKMWTEGASLEDIKKDFDSSIFFSSFDPLDSEHAYSQAGSLYGVDALTMGQASLKSNAAVVTQMQRFDGKTYKKLDPREQKNFVIRLAEEGKISLMGPESSFGHGVFQLRELEKLSLSGGIASISKQDFNYRSLSKGVTFQLAEGAADRLDLTPRISTTAYGEFFGKDATIPEFNMRIAGISPQERTLLGDMGAYKTWKEAQAYKPTFISRALEMGVNPNQATEAFEGLEKFYKNGGKGQSLMQQIAKLGETDALISKDLSKAGTVRHEVRYEVDQLHFKPEDYIGKDVGKSFKLGSNQNALVGPDAAGTILSVTPSGKESGSVFVTMEHHHALDAAKWDAFGVKGELHAVKRQEDFGGIVGMINNVRKKFGSKDFIDSSRVNALVDWTYAQNKMDPLLLRLSIAEDTVSTIYKMDKDEGSRLMKLAEDAFADKGVGLEKGQVIFYHELYAESRAARIQNLMELNEALDGIMSEAIKSIRNAKGNYGRAYSGWVRGSGRRLNEKEYVEDFEKYMLRNSVNVNVRTWAHSSINLPEHATVTHDLDTFLNLGDKRVVASELRNRLKTIGSGDPAISLRYGQYIQKRDFSKPLGEVIDLKEAFVNDRSIGTPQGKFGTIFDPANPKFKDNFSLKYVDQAGNEKYIPIPGNDAYKAITPEYNAAKGGVGYQIHDWQKKVKELYDSRKDPEAVERIINGTIKSDGEGAPGLVDMISNELLTGKNSAWRPRSFDPMGRTGYLTTGGVSTDPFRVGISRRELEALPRELRTSINKRGFATALITRQPYSEALGVKVVLDDTLKDSKLFSISESLRMLIRGDDDLDPTNLHYFSMGSDSEKAILGSIASGGRQERRLANFRTLMGASDEGYRVQNPVMKDLKNRAKSFLEEAADLSGAISRRTATEAVGTLSISSGRMLAHLEKAELLKNNEQARDFLEDIAFRLRQAPIDARKASGVLDKEMAMKISANVEQAFAMGRNLSTRTEAAELLRNTLLTPGILPSVGWTEEIGTKFGIAKPLDNLGKFNSEAKFNPAATWLKSDEGLEALINIMPSSKEAGEATDRWVNLISGKMTSRRGLAEVFNNLEQHVPPTMRKAFGAMLSAEDLGRLNKATATKSAFRSFAETASNVMKSPAGKLLLGGMAVAAGVGLLMNRPRQPKTLASASISKGRSSNEHRPEERIGVDGGIPGEAVTGSMAPTNPPRRPVYKQDGVSTAMVSPVNRNTRVEATIRTNESRKAVDLSRAVSQLASNGNVNATINYKVSNKLDSLRTRERIRELREGN